MFNLSFNINSIILFKYQNETMFLFVRKIIPSKPSARCRISAPASPCPNKQLVTLAYLPHRKLCWISSKCRKSTCKATCSKNSSNNNSCRWVGGIFLNFLMLFFGLADKCKQILMDCRIFVLINEQIWLRDWFWEIWVKKTTENVVICHFSCFILGLSLHNIYKNA